MNTRPDQLQRAAKHLQRTLYNGGMTYSSPELQESVLVIGYADSSEEVINTFSHELRHLVDDIAVVYNIASGSEEIAYLTGNIALSLAAVLLQIVCE